MSRRVLAPPVGATGTMEFFPRLCLFSQVTSREPVVMIAMAGGMCFSKKLAAAIASETGAKDLAKDYLERQLSMRSRERAPDDLRHL